VATDPLNFPGSSEIRYDPLGVVLVIGAWNYPIHLSLMPCVGAISAGNSVVLKMPSDKYVKHTSRVIKKLTSKYLDPRTFQCVEGAREMTQAVLQQKWDKIFFTGGEYVGKLVAASAANNLTPVVLELGGKSPTIVDETADLEIAAKRICWGRFMNAGQTCVAPDYLFVHEDVAEEFYEKLESKIKEFWGKDASKSEFYGRIVNERAFKRVKSILDKDREYIRVGGKSFEQDLYVEPTVMDFGDDLEAFSKSEAMSDEIFGPIYPCVQYSNRDDVINFINEKAKPLALYLFSTNSEFQERVLTETSSGNACVNEVVTHLSNDHLPFGGVGRSGMGSYHGHFSFECFSHRKGVLRKSNWLDIWARYPPYTPFKDRVLKLASGPIPKFKTDVLKWTGYAIAGSYLFRQRQLVGNVLRGVIDLTCGPAPRL